MDTNLGYTKPLYILAFDHRSSLIKKLFGYEPPYTPEQRAQVADYKHLIFEGLIQGVSLGVPKDDAAFLVEEEFGDQVLRDGAAAGYPFILTAEASGKDEFEFQYGDDFPSHIEKYNPLFTKALIRYNPEGDVTLNKRQLAQLKKLSDYSHEHGHKFLVEPLVPATDAQLAAVGGDKKKYDSEVRPKLVVEMVKQFQDAGVEPDIWKIEGMDKPEDYEAVVAQARVGGRDNVSAVVLGRGESTENVNNWLKAGAQVEGVIGFAIGRSIFWDVLMQYHAGTLTREQAAEEIGKNYFGFYKVFTE